MPANPPWNKKKKTSLANTPNELNQDNFSARPQYRRSRSAQSFNRTSPTIPEDDPVSHSTVPSLPTFTSIGASASNPDFADQTNPSGAGAGAVGSAAATGTGTGPANTAGSAAAGLSAADAQNPSLKSRASQLSMSNLSEDKRRQRANSVERDAAQYLRSNIGTSDFDDMAEDDEDEDEPTIAQQQPPVAETVDTNATTQQQSPSPPQQEQQEQSTNVPSANLQSSQQSDPEKKKRNVVFYDSDSESTSSNNNSKEKEKITSDDEAEHTNQTNNSSGNSNNNNNNTGTNRHNIKDAEISSVNSDSRASNFLTKVLNFKHSFKKRANGDEEQDIENNGKNDFELDFFSNDHPRRFFRKSQDEQSDHDDNDSDDEKEQIQDEVHKIMNAHTSKVSKFFHKKPKPGNKNQNNKNSPGGGISRSSSKSSLGDLFYTSYDAERANGPISNADDLEDDRPDDVMRDRLEFDEYVPPPKRVQEGVLSTLMKMYNLPAQNASSASVLDDAATSTTGWTGSTRFNDAGSTDNLPYNVDNIDDEIKQTGRLAHSASTENMRQNALGGRSGTNLLSPSSTAVGSSHDRVKSSSGSLFADMPSFKPSMTAKKKAELKKQSDKKLKKKKLEAKITVHLANLLQRKNFILKICTAFMIYGAPSHRLEEYMVMTSRVLEIDGQFMYFPGCMIVAFNDPTTKTTEMQLVRTKEGLNFAKLHDAHQIYKAVIHDLIGVDEASKKLDFLMDLKSLYPPWLCVLIYGFGSAMVCPFAFCGYWHDMPICFIIGCCVGFLQFYVSPKSAMYSNVFEIAASIVVSFLGRALGSIHHGRIFCFPALVQGSLALILPGFIILTGSMELQSRNIVNGSVRMFYAIIYSLFLSFGITIGAAIYGWIDDGAVGTDTCLHGTVNDKFKILFVPLFAIALSTINQASWKQIPTMVFIACVGYIVSYFSSKHFTSSSEFTSALAAMAIGVLGNLYSRIYKGLAISAMLPAIFVQVPSGIASQSSLIAGVNNADAIVSSLKNGTTTTSGDSDSSNSLTFGFSMIQVAVGITVGLFTASILVYPFGKKKTALFTF